MKISCQQEPFALFKNWINEAESNSKIIEPTAMNLATVDSHGKPSSRMVLLKNFNESGFYFFTNLTSQKGKELEENANVALCFYWGILGKQVRIEGEVEKVTQKEADDYFSSRRRGSQIGAWASKQSAEIENHQEFLDRIEESTNNFTDVDVSRPPFWSGFRVKPSRIEFWEEGKFRIHKRILYKVSQEGWRVSELYP